ncbi:protein-L-isoaspartate(D-aspartate) O-methyltransferase [Planctomicrobium sp. SH664]|uniref:protein-L-isoaspartate(D-aspartate) O-methyltransferase n=1 Tax=Planctomicrobium sp. SH664 TaxID=3448125 RepID=UPI003F5C020B
MRNQVCTLLVAGLLAAMFTTSLQAQPIDQATAARLRMVEEHIASEGVTNPQVLEAMRTVPRHLFVRPDLRSMAYLDQALDIGHKQTISPPFIVAYMTQELDPQRTDRVLEIGTGSGYQAAVLSGLVQEVYTIEIVEPLGKRAASLVSRLGYKNVHCKVGDGYQGWAEHAPFDKIIVTCSPEDVPQPLVDQLKEGGKMIIPLGERYQQVFHLLEKKNGELVRTKLIPTLFVPMTGQMEELRRSLPDGLHPRIINGGFEIDGNEDNLADNWHYQRRTRLSDEALSGNKCLQFTNAEPGRESHVLQGLAVDGTRVRQINISWAYRSEHIRPGEGFGQEPGMLIYFFDVHRLPIGRVPLGPWLADEDAWKRCSTTVDVPEHARELILRVGLNGATGTLWLDDVAITAN